MAAPDERSGDAHASPGGVNLHADRRLEPRFRRTRLRAELDALLFGQHLRIHQAHGAGVHRRKQPLERGDEHRSLRRLFLAAVGDFDRLHGSIRQGQRQAAQAAGQIEERRQPAQQVSTHPRHVDREGEVTRDQRLADGAADLHRHALLRFGGRGGEMRRQNHAIEHP